MLTRAQSFISSMPNQWAQSQLVCFNENQLFSLLSKVSILALSSLLTSVQRFLFIMLIKVSTLSSQSRELSSICFSTFLHHQYYSYSSDSVFFPNPSIFLVFVFGILLASREFRIVSLYFKLSEIFLKATSFLSA